ncbi:hypothetical protein LCGC14_1293300 [marine sediment metagenome]|uniref:Uncharacterized protein n=1 Tax=marine sediment metagenome TaxID=412755 RepID=A0A0F9NUR0_9ZZZZ
MRDIDCSCWFWLGFCGGMVVASGVIGGLAIILS